MFWKYWPTRKEKLFLFLCHKIWSMDQFYIPFIFHFIFWLIQFCSNFPEWCQRVFKNWVIIFQNFVEYCQIVFRIFFGCWLWLSGWANKYNHHIAPRGFSVHIVPMVFLSFFLGAEIESNKLGICERKSPFFIWILFVNPGWCLPPLRAIPRPRPLHIQVFEIAAWYRRILCLHVASRPPVHHKTPARACARGHTPMKWPGVIGHDLVWDSGWP